MALLGSGAPKFTAGGTVTLDNGVVISERSFRRDIETPSLLDDNGLIAAVPGGKYLEVEILVNLWKGGGGGLLSSIVAAENRRDCEVWKHSSGSAYQKYVGAGNALFQLAAVNHLYPDPTLDDYDQVLLRFVSVEYAEVP